ncbi:MAG: hypothetical protein KUG61_00230, partial [Parvibaculaceae bacterium]|nr:hypothetical protein [Parvibaculaceae bacterium]
MSLLQIELSKVQGHIRRTVATAALALVAVPSWAADQPNILVIWGDDIGQSNISAYTRGLMGYTTP